MGAREIDQSVITTRCSSSVKALAPPKFPTGAISRSGQLFPRYPVAPTRFAARKQLSLSFEFSECLSRACLGKMITFSFSVQSRQKAGFLPAECARMRSNCCETAMWSLQSHLVALFQQSCRSSEIRYMLTFACISPASGVVTFTPGESERMTARKQPLS